jgi:hypothetical protein
MQDDTNNFHQYIPSLNKDSLKKVIGRKLIEIKRSFGNDLQKDLSYFLERNSDKSLFYSHWIGGTQFCFEGGVFHAWVGYTEEYSVILLPQQLPDSWCRSLYSLSDSSDISRISERSCLGATCEDVRIWKFKDNLDPGSLAMEAGISYLLSNGQELFYCTHLHSDANDDDYLILKSEIQESTVESGFSLLENCQIEFAR